MIGILWGVFFSIFPFTKWEVLQNQLFCDFAVPPDCVNNKINHLLCGWWEKSLDIS